jgi:hypothetical protein
MAHNPFWFENSQAKKDILHCQLEGIFDRHPPVASHIAPRNHLAVDGTQYVLLELPDI